MCPPRRYPAAGGSKVVRQRDTLHPVGHLRREKGDGRHGHHRDGHGVVGHQTLDTGGEYGPAGSQGEKKRAKEGEHCEVEPEEGAAENRGVGGVW
eukprot:scaffold9041_cov65-Isochrysis_galbana.AAC.2